MAWRDSQVYPALILNAYWPKWHSREYEHLPDDGPGKIAGLGKAQSFERVLS